MKHSSPKTPRSAIKKIQKSKVKYLKYSDIKNSIAYNRIKSKEMKKMLFSPTKSAVIKRARETLYNFFKNEIKKDNRKKIKK